MKLMLFVFRKSTLTMIKLKMTCEVWLAAAAVKLKTTAMSTTAAARLLLTTEAGGPPSYV